MSELSFDPRPWEEMAKIDEHRLRDWARARTVVQEALARAEGGRAAADAREALGHRLRAPRAAPAPKRDARARRLGSRRGGAGKGHHVEHVGLARTRVPVGRVDEDGCEECTRRPEGSWMQ